jgi:Ubiquitin family
MKVNVLLNTNKVTLEDIEPHETIEAIKDIIFEKFKDVSAPLPDNPLAHTYLTTNHLRLLYKGKQLPNLSTLYEQDFKDDDTVLLFVSQKQQEDPQDDKNEIVSNTPSVLNWH